MPSDQDIRDQLEQLRLLRENMQFFRRQALAHGGLAAAPVATQRGLAGAYAEIARCKAVLRGWGVEVEDLPDDVAPPDEPTPARAPTPVSITFHNDASNNGAQGEFYGPVNINHNHPAPVPPTSSTLKPQQRTELLDRLARRYQDLLDHALAHQVRLQLGLHTRPDAVDPAWRRMLLRGPLTSQPVPPGTPLLELFDQQQGQLLVLGAPGAGKTTLIVELAQALTARAQAGGQARIPVVLNIAAWRSGQSLRDWLQRALRDVLGASRRFAAQLADGDDLLLLLDGLDEVAADHRVACVAAITAYLGERDLAPPLVVGCRSREYADLGTQLPIAGAVELEPLELPAIERALEGVPAAAGVLAALQTDELLRELATTPLMVNVLLLAHGGQEVPMAEVQTLEERRRALWWAYVRRALVQRPPKGPAMVLRYLRWLAQVLRGQSETNFLIDDLQPSIVPLRPSHRRYWWRGGLGGGIAGVLLGALLGWTAVAVANVNLWTVDGRLSPLGGLLVVGIWGCLWGSIVGGLIGLVYDIVNKTVQKPLQRMERVSWSWVYARAFVLSAHPNQTFSVPFVALGLVGGVLGWLFTWSISGVIVGTVFCTILVLCLGLYLGGYQTEDVLVRMTPMHSLNISPRVIFITMSPLCIFFGLCFGLFGVSLGVEPIVAIVGGLAVFLGFTLFWAFRNYIHHYALRTILWRAGLFPFRAVTFLEAMTERLLLERDGALYRFRHLLLRDFIAGLSDAEIDELARGL
ncbi:MAG: hypothetical protein OHK0022_46630 [Roseiflexaceae bacterium]